MQTVFTGIDPGLHGGIVCIDANNKILFRHTTPITKDNEYRVSEMLMLVEKGSTKYNIVLTIEEPIAMPKQSVKGTATTFKGYGIWTALINISLLAKIQIVSPNEWSRVIIPKDGSKKKLTYEEKKVRNALLAQKLFPDFRPPKTSEGLKEIKSQGEALLIALWGKQHYLGDKKVATKIAKATEKPKPTNENFFSDLTDNLGEM